MANKTKSKPKAKDTEKPIEDKVELQDHVTQKPRTKDYIKATLLMMKNWAKSHRIKATLAVVVLAVATTLLVVYLWPTKEPLTNQEIVNIINKSLSISGEANPAVLTVEDKSKATQPFLEQAQNGDKVVLYYNARKAVVFRPSEERIVHQGSYTPPEAKLFIRKGTTQDTRIDEVRSRLGAISDIEIVSQDSSTKQDYQGLVLVSVTDRYDEKIAELERLFGIKVSRLPAGETFPDADIMLIVGN